MRTAAHRPEILTAIVGHLRATLRAGSVSPLLKQLIAVRIGQIRQCDPFLVEHMAQARRLGAKAEQIEAMRALAGSADETPSSFPSDCLGTAPIEPPPDTRGTDEAVFTPAERAALVFADHMARGSGRVPEECFLDLAANFTASEIVEIASTTSLCDSLCRFSNALEIDAPGS